jgi:large-conductance mechanosensitive channel
LPRIAITGGLDFSNYYTALSAKVESGGSYADAKKQGAVLGWGQFLTVVLNFLIIAWVLFIAIKGLNKWKREALLCVSIRGNAQQLNGAGSVLVLSFVSACGRPARAGRYLGWQVAPFDFNS